MIGVCLTASVALLAGIMYLIHSIADPVQGNVAAVAAQTAERFNAVSSQTSERFNVFQESIRSLREDTAADALDLGAEKVGLGRLEDRLAAVERRWDQFDQHDYAGALDRVEQKQDDLAKARDRDIDRASR